MQNQIVLLKSTFSSLNDTRGIILYADVEEFEKESDRNPGTVRKVSIRKAFVTFAQRKCSEAKILNI